MAKDSKNKAHITPLGDRVLLEIPTREEKTKGGIIIPETANQEKPEQGKVIAVGGGRVTDTGDVIPVRVKVGDTVVFPKYGYDEITVGDTTYYILKEENILAVIK
ncbi:co-chaperone GroES [Candidatus Kaiserbacteria bacterium]|nr:co-chaperone GroES [Candidatus Kaiserbacteria bacterium]